MLFENLYTTADASYSGGSVETYASKLRGRLEGDLQQAIAARPTAATVTDTADTPDDASSQPTDFRKLTRQGAIETLRNDADFWSSFNGDGITWGVVKYKLKESLPDSIEDRDDLAYQMVAEALDELVGAQDEKWHTERRIVKSSGKEKVWIVKGPKG